MSTGREQHPEIEAMKRLLHTRTRKRRHPGGHHYFLNLRAKGLRGGRIVLRDPDAPGWPDRGPVAKTKGIALEWCDAYVDRLGVEWCEGTKPLETVAIVGEQFLAHLKEIKGEDSSSFKNGRSIVRNHIVPVLGEKLLRTVGAKQVQELLDDLTTVAGEPAGKALKESVLAGISNLWRHAHPKYPVPWRNQITIDRQDPGRARRERAAAGIRITRTGRGFTIDELRWILICAVAIDLAGERNPRKRRGLNNHADLIAFLTHHMVRIEEPCFMRGFDVDREARAVLIPGTKSSASEERLFPTQRSYEPWLDRLMAATMNEDDFLFPTKDSSTLPSVDAAKTKVLRVLDTAGLKRPSELTHAFRASNTSVAVAKGVSAEIIAALSGRRIPGDSELSDHYLRWRAFIASLDEAVFNYFPSLGTPEEVAVEAEAALRTGRIKVAGWR